MLLVAGKWMITRENAPRPESAGGNFPVVTEALRGMAISAKTPILRNVFVRISGKPLLGMLPAGYTRIPWKAELS